MSFESFGLHPSLTQVFTEIGYKTPTPIQAQSIPIVMQGKDLLGSAQTGTGKTAAFLLPVLHRLLTEPAQGTQVLVLEPTRELAAQVEEQAKVFAKYTSLRCACVYGGVAFGPQEKAFADGVEIIAATPGRLLDHLRQGNVRFDKLRVLVLDEVDRMLDMGFLPDVRSILRQLPDQRQTLFFSATVPSEIGRLADSMLKEPAKVAITPERKTAEGITQQIFPVPDHLKPLLLERLLNHEHVNSALVFTRTKQGADKVCAVIERRGLNVARIHGDLSQSQRLKALAEFKSGEVKFLVATDIAARGIDVDGITHVFNYDLPDSPDDYVHRIGRTARAGETGHAYSLFSPRDAAALSGIEKHLSQKIERTVMADFDYEETLGPQHEVRQGHNVRDFDNLGRKGSFSEDRPRPFRDADDRASVTLLFSPNATVDQAISGASEDAGADTGGRSGGGRDRGRGGRGGSGGGGGRDRGGRGGGRGGSGGGGSDRGPRRDFDAPRSSERDSAAPERKDRHSANAALSATDVLRKASDQQAVVGSDMMDLRPRGESADDEGDDNYNDSADNNQAPNASGAPAGGDQGDRPKRRRRRRGRGGNGGEGRAEGETRAPQQQGQGQNQNRDQHQGRNQNQGQQSQQRSQGGGNQGGPRNDGRQGGNRNDSGRNNRFDRNDRRPGGNNNQSARVSSAPKPSLWQRLKGSLGLGSSGGGSLGDKW